MTDAELDTALTDAYAEGRRDQAEITRLRAVLAQPASDLERYLTANYPDVRVDDLTARVIDALETMDFALGMKEYHAALAQPVQPQEPVGHLYTIAGIQHCTIEKVLPDGPLYTQPVQPAVQIGEEPECSTHPDAPHGFDRNGSHNNRRYTCDCEGWEPLAIKETQ